MLLNIVYSKVLFMKMITTAVGRVNIFSNMVCNVKMVCNSKIRCDDKLSFVQMGRGEWLKFNLIDQPISTAINNFTRASSNCNPGFTSINMEMLQLNWLSFNHPLANWSDFNYLTLLKLVPCLFSILSIYFIRIL